MRICETIGMEKLGNPVVVDIQNVQDFMAAQERGPEERSWDSHVDFPCWLSPWPVAVYEWKQRPFGHMARDHHIMIHVEVHQLEDKAFQEKLTVVGIGDIFGAPNHPTWLFDVIYYVRKDGSGEDGTFPMCVSDNVKTVFASALGNGFDGGDVLLITYPMLFATSLMACRNVAVKDVAPPEKLARAQLKKRGVPKVTYKVLDIAPMQKTLRSEGDMERNGLQKALHICRGHFAHYGPDHPLFGKYTGTFWKPMHIRGSASAGVVHKDYRVTA